MLLSARQCVNYSEHNISKDRPLTRMQLWLAACPERKTRCCRNARCRSKPIC